MVEIKWPIIIYRCSKCNPCFKCRQFLQRRVLCGVKLAFHDDDTDTDTDSDSPDTSIHPYVPYARFPREDPILTRKSVSVSVSVSAPCNVQLTQVEREREREQNFSVDGWGGVEMKKITTGKDGSAVCRRAGLYPQQSAWMFETYIKPHSPSTKSPSLPKMPHS